MLHKIKKPQIEFFSPNWYVRKYYPVLPANKYLPSQWKSLPRCCNSVKTAKSCPGISDWLTMGYIIPAWTDFEITQKDNKIISATAMNNKMFLGSHSSVQNLDLFSHKSHLSDTIKLPCEWRIKTSKGWSIQIVPLWYFQHQPWETLPGVIHSDNHSTQVNINMILTSCEENITVSAGTPLVQIIPYKRESVTAVSRATTRKDIKREGLFLNMYEFTKNGILKFYRKKTVSFKMQQKDLDFEKSLKYPLQ